MMHLMHSITSKERRRNYSTGKLRSSRELWCSEGVISVPTRKGGDVVSLVEQVDNITILSGATILLIME